MNTKTQQQFKADMKRAIEDVCNKYSLMDCKTRIENNTFRDEILIHCHIPYKS